MLTAFNVPSADRVTGGGIIIIIIIISIISLITILCIYLLSIFV
jgi:hypothetical protein